MKYYVDLGMHNGDLLEKVISIFPSFDKYIGFEPVPQLYAIANERFKYNDKVSLVNKAVSTKDSRNVNFYLCYCNKLKKGEVGYGSTLLKEKRRRFIDKNKHIKIEVIDFSKYLKNNFEENDNITLKVDIEGEEYNLFNHIIENGTIKYINKIYCEWHYHKMYGYKKNPEKFKNRHDKIISMLNKFGFDLKGNNVYDELSSIIKK